MNRELTPVEGVLWAGLATVSSVLGWRGILALIWLTAMIIDYFTGTLVAVKDGEWSSLKAREGLWHKGGMLFVVLAAVLLDILLMTVQQTGLIAFPFVYNSVCMPVVMAGYSITETGSIIENAALLGAPIPAWLRKVVKIAGQAAEQAGDALSGPDSDADSQRYVPDPQPSVSAPERNETDGAETDGASDGERRDADSAEDGT